MPASTQVPPEEVVVHKDLVALSNHLREMKKSTFTLHDIEKECDKLAELVQELRTIRQSEDDTRRTHTDEVLDDIWLELFQLWTKVANVDKRLYPTFTKLSAISKQLQLLDQSGAYTAADVLPLQEALTEIETKEMIDGKFVAHGQKSLVDAGNPDAGQAILSGLLHRSRRQAHVLLEKDEALDPSLQPILGQLVQLQHILDQYKSRGTYSLDDIHQVQSRLDLIDASRKDGKFELNDSVPAGQARLMEVTSRMYDEIYQMQSTKEEVSGPLRPTFEQLVEIGKALEKLRHSKRFTVTPLDLEPLQSALSAIDGTRKDNIFVVEGSTAVEPGQAACSQQLAHNYSLIHSLLMVTESVDDELLPVMDELSKVRTSLMKLARRARAVKRHTGGKPVSKDEVVPLHARMEEFEETHKRDGGKIVPTGWKEGDTVPSGQAVLSSIESQVYSLLSELNQLVH